MPRFSARWLEVALAQYDALPAAIQRQIDARVEQLLESPEGPRESYDARRDQWVTTYGDGTGLILYAVVHEHRRVLILRLVQTADLVKVCFAAAALHGVDPEELLAIARDKREQRGGFDARLVWMGNLPGGHEPPTRS